MAVGSHRYEPLDLRGRGNAGSEALAGGPSIDVGPRTFHGLPFRIGSSEGASFILLRPEAPDVVIPVGRSAIRVIVAHRRLPEAEGEGAPRIGDVVAEYAFEREGRPAEVVPIRERFEIAVTPEGWAWESPFLAVGAGTADPLDRDRGRWDEIGLRQTQLPNRDAVTELFLWDWENPRPDEPLTSIRIASRGSGVLVAAITLSDEPEEPFVRTSAVPVRITLADRAVGDAVTVEVDRGLATLPYPLPGDDVDGFLADPRPGWGQVRDPESRTAYARVAALPSATVQVGGPDGTLGRVRWGDVTASGAAQDGPVRVEVVEDGRAWVHVRVLDGDSERPVPCRVHFRSPAGVPYQPHGHHDHVNADLGSWHVDVGGDVRLGRLTYAYIDGTCQGWLPVGDVLVDAARGFEYEPLRERIRIERGQRELVLRLRRFTSANERGWYSGDSHVHFLSSQGALTEQRGEDLNVVNLLQSQWGSLFTNTEDFTGRPFADPEGPYVTYVGQENRQHFLGHLILWGLTSPIMPWCTDGPIEAEMGGGMEVTESAWADRCHEQGGTVVIPHFPAPNGEPATLIATGRADAVEMIVQQRRFHQEYYGYLNAGYRLPLVGGTDKMSSGVPVGLYRTYADLGDEAFSYDAWRRAVVAGRTFLSGGPLLTLEVDGRRIGDTVPLDGPGTVSVSASAESILPVHSLEVVHNGRVVASATDEAGARRLDLQADVPVEANGWIAARAGGPNHFDGSAHLDEWGRGMFGHTSPIYVAPEERWSMFDPAHVRYMLTLVEGSLAYVGRRATMDPEGSTTHHHDDGDHRAFLERPFREAQELLQRRLDEGR
jgi:hypothetical protein